jgi:hypothetical protein
MRVSYCAGVDLMLQFRLERGDDMMKHCRKMKRRHRAHLDLMRRKRDTVRRYDDVDRRRGGAGEGKVRRRHQLD